MDNITLSAEEIIVIASTLGISEVYGVPNVFKNYTQNQLFSRIDEVKNKLIEKEVLQVSFSKGICVNEKVKTLLHPLLLCDKFISLDRRINNRKNDYVVIYVCEEESLMAVYENSLFRLSTYKLECESFIRDVLVCNKDVKQEEINMTMTIEELKMLQENSDYEKELIKEGKQKQAIELINKTFASIANYYSFSFVIPKKTHNGFKNIMIIDDLMGKLKLETSIKEDYTDSITIVSTTSEEIVNEISNNINWIKGENICQV